MAEKGDGRVTIKAKGIGRDKVKEKREREERGG